MGGAGGAAAGVDLIGEEAEEVVREEYVFGLEVAGFFGIGVEVVELDEREMAGVVLAGAGLTPTARAGGDEEFPVLFAVGE